MSKESELRTEIQTLRNALKPFRNAWDAIDHTSPVITRGTDYEVYITDSSVPVKTSDFKKAMEVLEDNHVR